MNMLTIEEVLERLKITRSTLYRWMQSGELKAYKLGKKTLFKPEDIDALIVPRTAAVPDYRPDPEELAELLERIEDSEAALARGEHISTDQVRAELARFKESLLKQKVIA